MPKYKKRPVIVDAEQWDGTEWQAKELGLYNWLPYADGKPFITAELNIPGRSRRLRPGDWIITDYTGQRRVCSAAKFEQTYEPVEQPAEI